MIIVFDYFCRWNKRYFFGSARWPPIEQVLGGSKLKLKLSYSDKLSKVY